MLNLFKRQASSCPQTEITAVISGRLLPLSEVRDEVFAQKMLGDGAAVQPEGEIVAAPCDGKITMLYPTLHAFGLVILMGWKFSCTSELYGELTGKGL